MLLQLIFPNCAAVETQHLNLTNLERATATKSPQTLRSSLATHWLGATGHTTRFRPWPVAANRCSPQYSEPCAALSRQLLPL